MLCIDYNFFYKNSVRTLLFYKLFSLTNIKEIPSLSKLICSFSLSKIDDCDDVQVYNYCYLFKFFFGRIAYLTRVKSFYNLGIWSYSFRVFIIFQDKEIFNKLFFIINDLLYRLDNNFINFGIFSIKLNIFYLSITDLNIFSEKKTNLGLFNLKQNLDFKFFCTGFDIQNSKVLFRNLKIYLF